MKRTREIALLSSWILGLTVCAAASIAQASTGEELERLLFTRLLLDEDPNISRLGARSIAPLPTGDAKQSLSDLTAEHVVKLVDADPTLTSGTADTVGWHVNVLATDLGRYRDVLNQVRQRITHLKWQARLDVTLQSPDAETVERYAIRDVDLAAIKADADRQWTAGHRRDRTQFVKISTGSSLSTVLATLGSPDAVTPTNVRVAKYGRTQMLTLHYAQSGMVLFKVDPPPAREWKAFEFVDEIFDINAIYVGQQFGMAQAIAGLRGSRFRDYMIYNGTTIGSSAEFMPILEHRLMSTPVAADKFELDAMRRCLRIIYGYASSEAIQSLRRIADASTERHVKKDAGTYATRLEQRPTTGTLPQDATKDEPTDEESDDDAV